MACPALQYVSTLSHTNGRIFGGRGGGGGIEHEMYGLAFFYNFVRKIYNFKKNWATNNHDRLLVFM